MSSRINLESLVQFFNGVTTYFKIVETAPERSKMLDIFLFVEEVHAWSSCEENECQVETYMDLLNGALFDPEKSRHRVKEAFVLHSVNYQKKFSCMLETRKRPQIHFSFA